MSHPLIHWSIAAALLAALPILLPATSTLTILNQMAITTVFALSYNMLLGQAGMLSFGHAIYFGLGGFACIHVINAAPGIPLPLLPLLAGLFSLAIAALIGAFSTHRSGTLFAMISLGVVELIAALSIIIIAFFTYGGASADRTLGPTIFGTNFAQQIDVYYLIAAWTLAATAAMYAYTKTPIGRLANAVRDNPERLEFIGYSARWLRFFAFCGAGFFAGIAGGLFAINYEIASAETLSLSASGTILMIAFLGGTGHFFGPILGAILFTLLQTVLSLHTELWQLYLGILFVTMVMFCPSGLAGILLLHAPLLTHTKATLVPYLKTILPGAVSLMAFAIILEMLNFLRDATNLDTPITLFWVTFNAAIFPSALVTLVAFSCFMIAKRNAPALAAAWQIAQKKDVNIP